MSTRGTLFQTPTVEIYQSRYEELLKKELKYEQYKKQATQDIIKIIEEDNGETINSESEE